MPRDLSHYGVVDGRMSDRREALLDQMNAAQRAMLAASAWCRDVPPYTGCHDAAYRRWCRAHAAWIAAEQRLADHDHDGSARAFHARLARRIREAVNGR